MTEKIVKNCHKLQGYGVIASNKKRNILTLFYFPKHCVSTSSTLSVFF